jgi:uncharacterized OB-fold protein
LAIKKTTVRTGRRSLPHCDAKIFPPRDVCPNCGGEAKTEFAFSGKGKIYSYTIMRDAPAGYEENIPYTVAVVALDEGPMVTAQLTDLGEKPVEIGMPVEMVTRKIRQDGDERGMLVYGISSDLLCERNIITRKEKTAFQLESGFFIVVLREECDNE